MLSPVPSPDPMGYSLGRTPPMTRANSHILLFGWFFLGTAILLGQDPAELLSRIERLESEMRARQEAFETRLQEVEAERDSLRSRVDSLVGLEEQIQAQVGEEIEAVLKSRIKFYQRPSLVNDQRPLFDAIQGGLIMTGLFRSRVEWRHNNVDFNTKGIDDQGVRLNGRFRLGFGAVIADDRPRGPKINALTEFQAHGDFANNGFFFGQNSAGTFPLPDEGSVVLKQPFEEVKLYQGYLEFKELFADEFRLVIGRQELVLGTQFLFGDDSFGAGLTHDGVLTEWKADDWTLSAFYTLEAQRDLALIPPVTGIDDFDGDWMAGLYLEVRPTEDLVLDAYAIHFEARRSDEAFDLLQTATARAFDNTLFEPILGSSWTLGGRAFLGRIPVGDGYMAIGAELAYQTGSADDGVTIHGVSGEFLLNWWFDAPGSDGLNPVLSLRYYYASGGSESGRHRGFQPLFINRHLVELDRNDPSRPHFGGGGRYGNMDLVPLSNIHLAKLVLSIAPSDSTEVGIGYMLAVTADNEGYGTGLFGHEIDLFGTYRYDYAEGNGKGTVVFSANASVFFPGRSGKAMSQFLFAPILAENVIPQISDRDMAFAFYIQALISF